jgi:Zn-dependent peptidase ImmA (M78 family)/DNA-binding XRE family transcriptional regulator
MPEDRFIENPFIGERITQVRKLLNLSQVVLAEQIGYANRQTLQTIEKGTRRLRASELVRLVEATGYSVEFFTDPLLWTGDGTFSYRCSVADPAMLDAFEEKAGGLVALWRHCEAFSATPSKSVPEFLMDARNSFEDAQGLAQTMQRWLRLGETPATRLSRSIEGDLGIPVLYIEMPSGVSGATFRHEGNRLLFVNRNDAAGRRNYDLAHELFHVLTWSHQAPERIDRSDDNNQALSAQQRRFEQLAENFAAALLMPRASVTRLWESIAGSQDLKARTEAVRQLMLHFSVSAKALLWRLVNLECISKEDVPQLEQQLSALREETSHTAPSPELFSRLYLERVAGALERGSLSVRRVASILDLEIDDMAEAIASHGLSVPFDI